MFESMITRVQTASKPLNALMAVNVEATEKIVGKQAELFTGLLREGLAFSQNVSEQVGFSGIFASGKNSLSKANDHVLSVSKDIYDVMTETQEKTGEVMRESFATMKEAASNSKPARAVKSVVAKTGTADK